MSSPQDRGNMLTLSNSCQDFKTSEGGLKKSRDTLLQKELIAALLLS